MKYGILAYNKSIRPGSKNWANLGDPIQSYAMVSLYEEMGIKEDELVRISRYQTKEYDEEYVVLPYNCYNMIFNQYKHTFNSFPVSDKIIPVFTSFHLHSRVISEDIINQFKTYEPIGCRDEETSLLLRKYGIRTYLSGCVTATLPKRKITPKSGKVFLVDIPTELIKHIPTYIMDDAEYVTHLPDIPRTSDTLYLTDEEEMNYYNRSINQLKTYENEAKLVVTSRLHAASPCLALGIPVILVSENFDGRFSWIDKYLRLYTPDQFSQINWNPLPIDYEQDKAILKTMFINHIQKAYNDNYFLYDGSSIYENRERAYYNKRLVECLSKLPFQEMSHIKYALWGLRADTLNFHNTIIDYFPNWKLEAVIDENTTGIYEGMNIIKSSEIQNLAEDIIYFVIPEAAHKFAANFLSSEGLSYILVHDKCRFTYVQGAKSS